MERELCLQLYKAASGFDHLSPCSCPPTPGHWPNSICFHLMWTEQQWKNPVAHQNNEWTLSWRFVLTLNAVQSRYPIGLGHFVLYKLIIPVQTHKLVSVMLREEFCCRLKGKVRVNQCNFLLFDHIYTFLCWWELAIPESAGLEDLNGLPELGNSVNISIGTHSHQSWAQLNTYRTF